MRMLKSLFVVAALAFCLPAIAGDYGYQQPFLNITAPNTIDGISVNPTTPAAGNFTTVSANAGVSITGGALSFPAARKGTFVCTSGGSITVANTNAAITSNILITLNTVGGTVSTAPAVSAITAATSFVAKCATSDTSTYNYTILN